MSSQSVNTGTQTASADSGAVMGAPVLAGSGNPFARRTVIIMFAIGLLAFTGFLFALGAGNALRDARNGDAHGASNSLVGYSALAQLFDKTGATIEYSRQSGNKDADGLMIITPNMASDAEELAKYVAARRYYGPTVIIVPKWSTSQQSALKSDWVQLNGPDLAAAAPQILKDITAAEIQYDNRISALAPADYALAKNRPKILISGPDLIPVVGNVPSKGAQIVLLDNGGWYPGLDENAVANPEDYDDIDRGAFPVVIIADADLANNLGLADKATARRIFRLLQDMRVPSDDRVIFDLVFNGLGSQQNLLTVAFKPPFLAATICLLLSAIGLAWIAFNRFGPPITDARAIGFGKAALIDNSAGLLRRLRRDNAIANAYADVVRVRAAKAIGLPENMPHDEVAARLNALQLKDGNRFDAADRPVSAHDDHGFEQLSNALRAVQNERDLSNKAAALARWKKELLG